MHPRHVPEHFEQAIYHSIRASLAIGAVNGAVLGDGDLDAGGMLLTEVQDCIFDATLYMHVSLILPHGGEIKREHTSIRLTMGSGWISL